MVLCAGAPDTIELADECKSLIEEVQKTRDGVVWIQEAVPHEELRVLYSHATVFATPSLYEPFGIINLEAMSCGTPVVGSAVGGIPEMIDHQKNGYVASLRNSDDLADGIGWVLSQADASLLSQNALRKVSRHYSQSSVALRYVEIYHQVLAPKQFNI